MLLILYKILYKRTLKASAFIITSGGVFWFKVGMVDSDQLLNKLRALCTKLDAPTLPTSIEEAQEVLRK